MDKIRIGIVGMGHIGQFHANYLLAGHVPRAELVAVCNRSPGKLQKYKSLKLFERGEDLMGSGLVDAVVVATPHQEHLQLALTAMNQGLHLMMEKPIAAHIADGQRLIAAYAQKPGLLFAGMFQLRVEQRYARIHQIIRSGELGEIVRVSWIVTDWFRKESYYASSPWRATWKGAGGGALLTQCLHNLDCLQWLLGMPSRVCGFCQLGRFHHVEVEDNVTAYFEFPDDVTGMFVSSTGEAPGTNRLEIAGTLGKLVLERDKLLFTRNASDMIQFGKTVKEEGPRQPETSLIEVPIEKSTKGHASLMRNFVNAILDGEPLLVPGAEGLKSLELANAILYSSLTRSAIDLPLDAVAYEACLSRMIAQSEEGPRNCNHLPVQNLLQTT